MTDGRPAAVPTPVTTIVHLVRHGEVHNPDGVLYGRGAAAITHARVGASKLWAGSMVVQPDAKTGPHHHGELETVLYVVRGHVRMRWGDHLELSDEAGPGDFIYVPQSRISKIRKFVPTSSMNGYLNPLQF